VTQELRIASFSPHVESDFRVTDLGGAEIVLRLTEAQAGALQPDAPRVEPFTLVFTGPALPNLEQGIHRLEHPKLGGLDIFLVPIGYDATGSMRYEAVFN
jgi:predicted glycosyltransferase